MPTETIDTRTSRRRRATFAVAALTVLAAVIAALTLGTEPTAADEPDIVATPLTGLSNFTDDVAVQVRDKPDGRHTEVVNLRDASRTIVAEVTIQPGAKFPWHTHPGMAMVVIANGTTDDEEPPFEYIYDNCDTYAYQVGEAFIDPGFDNVHMARNPSDQVTTAIVTFVGVTEPHPEFGLTVPIDPDEGAALDVKCGITR